MGFAAPMVDQSNFELLCKSNSIYRVYCLIEVTDGDSYKAEGAMKSDVKPDAALNSINDKWMHEMLQDSRKTYLQDVFQDGKENASNDDIFRSRKNEDGE